MSRQVTASKTLLWQWREIQKNPIDGVLVSPLEINLYEWHGNIYFDEFHKHFPSMRVHFKLKFSSFFPSKGPDLKLVNSFTHSHVFGSALCWSLVNDFASYFRYSGGVPETAGWNPSRTVRSFLEDMYQFLTVDEDEHVQITANRARWDMDQALETCCNTCGHRPHAAFPNEETWLANKIEGEDKENAALAFHDFLSDQQGQVAVERKSKTEIEGELKKLGNISVRLEVNSAADPPKPTIMENLRSRLTHFENDVCTTTTTKSLLNQPICTFTRASGLKGSAVLGFGINVSRDHNKRLQINTDLEPLTLVAFQCGLRKSALGNSFNHFMPFALNEFHWNKAEPILRRVVHNIIPGDEITYEEKLLQVVGELWKTLLVDMMKGDVHASEKVLKGFISLHHLLLMAALGDEKQLLVQIATQKMRNFIAIKAKRTKDFCPDLGAMIPVQFIADTDWKLAKQAFLEELLTRNALWIIKKERSLRILSAKIPDRVEKSFHPSKTGLQLFAFQMQYLQNARLWANVPTGSGQTCEKILIQEFLEQSVGAPTQEMINTYQQQAKYIQKLKNFPTFFKLIEMPRTDKQIKNMLLDAMRASRDAGYHF